MTDTRNPLPLSQAKNSDLRGVPAAMARAQQAAKELAIKTNTALVIQQNGQMVKLTFN